MSTTRDAADAHRFLYQLRDPRSGRIRWVGHTSNPKAVARTPRGMFHNKGLREWLRSLRASGLRPAMQVLAVLIPDDADITADRLILKYRAAGIRLFNRPADREQRRSMMLQQISVTRALRPAPAFKVLHSLDLHLGCTAYTDSRLAVLVDGTPCPVLLLLAQQVFDVSPEGWSRLGLFPFWLDGNALNEVPENIGLAQRAPRAKTPSERREAAKPDGRRGPRSYGGPA